MPFRLFRHPDKAPAPEQQVPADPAASGLLPVRHRRRGEGLNSVVLGLGVIAGVIGMYFFMGGSANDDQKIQRAQAQITTIVKTMTDSYGTIGGTVPAGSLNAALVGSNKLPSTSTPWGDTLTVTGSGAATYTISSNYPASACATLASRRLGGAMQSVQVGGNPAASSIDFATAASQCGSTSAVVTWTLVP